MIIGIPVSFSDTRYFLNRAYITYVIKSGFIPKLLLPEVDITEQMENVDGLLLPGGIDVDPIYYGDDNFSSIYTDPEKDIFERELFYIAIDMGIKVFGICRGLQLIAYELIKRIINPQENENIRMLQHIHMHNQGDEKAQKLNRKNHSHFVHISPNIYNDESVIISNNRMPVNSLHHQCVLVKNLEPICGLNILAYTRRGLSDLYKDYIIAEALRTRIKSSDIMAVQWHPEELLDIPLLRNFFLQETRIDGEMYV